MTDEAQPSTAHTAQRIGFFGPLGTFTQQALLGVDTAQGAAHIPYRTVPDVLDAVETGEVDAGFVPIENSIEGMVNFTQDALAFDHELVITHEVVIDIEHCLLVKPGVSLDEVSEILSIPVATAQCHRYLRERLPDAEVIAANSTEHVIPTIAYSGSDETMCGGLRP